MYFYIGFAFSISRHTTIYEVQMAPYYPSMTLDRSLGQLFETDKECALNCNSISKPACLAQRLLITRSAEYVFQIVPAPLAQTIRQHLGILAITCFRGTSAQRSPHILTPNVTLPRTAITPMGAVSTPQSQTGTIGLV